MLNEKEFLRLISDSIRKRRLAGKISSEKLSELSGMDYSSINLIENQKQNPRSYSLYKLLFALDIDITKDLKEDISQQDVKDKIIRKLNLMTDSQKESLLKLIDNCINIACFLVMLMVFPSCWILIFCSKTVSRSLSVFLLPFGLPAGLPERPF